VKKLLLWICWSWIFFSCSSILRKGYCCRLLWEILWYEVHVRMDGYDMWRHAHIPTQLRTYVHTRHNTHTYIHCGHIWHRNKLSSCQLKLLASCGNDEHQTSLQWNRNSHPVAPECRVSHTLCLKYFGMKVLRFNCNCIICWVLLHIM
jgi:hypothetical protein